MRQALELRLWLICISGGKTCFTLFWSFCDRPAVKHGTYVTRRWNWKPVIYLNIHIIVFNTNWQSFTVKFEWTKLHLKKTTYEWCERSKWEERKKRRGKEYRVEGDCLMPPSAMLLLQCCWGPGTSQTGIHFLLIEKLFTMLWYMHMAPSSLS